MKNRPLSACLTLVLVILSGCTAEQIYTNVQEDHRRQCRQLPVWQQEHCLSLNDTSWEDYVRERRILDDQNLGSSD